MSTEKSTSESLSAASESSRGASLKSSSTRSSGLPGRPRIERLQILSSLCGFVGLGCFFVAPEPWKVRLVVLFCGIGLGLALVGIWIGRRRQQRLRAMLDEAGRQ